MKNQKGITLVALIITIIVMLILVAVSVAVVINSNILGTAEKTGEKYKQEAANESTIGEGNIIKGSDGKNHSVEYYVNKAGLSK